MTHFISYGQNSEDVVLYRALKDIKRGHYIDVGANHPRIMSISYAFYQLGWEGILIEPLQEMCSLLSVDRPRDVVVECAASDRKGGADLLVPAKNTRSTLVPEIACSYQNIKKRHIPTDTLNNILVGCNWARENCHFMSIDIEGAELLALEGLDLEQYRPWIICIEAINPITLADNSSEWVGMLSDAGYSQALFDGVNKFFYRDDKPDLVRSLSYPACSTDDFVTYVPEKNRNRVVFGS